MDKSRLDDGTVLVAFELPAAVAATSVSLCGDFNDWSPDTHPLARLDDGRFRTELTLPAGHRWRFRYLLDGERWENDWAADDYVPNGLGADDSIVDLTDPESAPPAVCLESEAEGVSGAETGAVDSAVGRADAETLPAEATHRRPWWRFWGRRSLTTA